MNSDILKGQWKQWAGKAKETWGKLAEDEWLRLEGNAQQLAGLVQERYGVTREDAERQVQSFIARVLPKRNSAAAQKPVKYQPSAS